jgi:DNA invertase Pin-like site-specific DNA recombinase
MNGQHVGYIRVSSVGQNTGRQLDGVTLDVIYEEKLSGKDRNRPELANMLKAIRCGDTVHVHSMDRLARNMVDLCSLVGEITDKGATIIFHKENLTFAGSKADPMAELMLGILGSVAQFERAIIKERQAEGIAKAKENGVYDKHGRKPHITPAMVEDIKRRIDSGEKKARIAKSLGISRDSLYRLIKQ